MQGIGDGYSRMGVLWLIWLVSANRITQVSLILYQHGWRSTCACDIVPVLFICFTVPWEYGRSRTNCDVLHAMDDNSSSSNSIVGEMQRLVIKAEFILRVKRGYLYMMTYNDYK
jgi:hypothetical protein